MTWFLKTWTYKAKEGNNFERNTIDHLGPCQSELKYRSSIHLHIGCWTYDKCNTYQKDSELYESEKC